MNKIQKEQLTLQKVMEKYELYNDEISQLVNSIISILDNDQVTDKEFNIFSEFEEFNFQLISLDDLKGVQLSYVIDLICNIFKTNLEAFHKLDINNRSETYNRLIEIFSKSTFAKTELINGLHKLFEFAKCIDDLSGYDADTFVATKIVGTKIDNIKDCIFNVSTFLNRISSCSNDVERLNMIRNEIRNTKINCIGNEYLSESQEVKGYIEKIEEIESVIKLYSDASLDGGNNYTAAKDIYSNSYLNGDASKNRDHTAMRKSIAMYYLFNEISPELFSDGNRRAMARFTSFITGNSEDNIYKIFGNIFSEMDKNTPTRRKDFEFVINELDKINLGEVSDRIKKDMKGGTIGK